MSEDTRRRRSIDVSGIAHKAPIPMGARVGSMVFSSAIMGMDPQTGTVPDDVDEQMTLVFANLRSFLGRAGVEPDDVGKVDVFLRDTNDRERVNREWLAMFPDPEDRPARHISVMELPGNIAVQLAVIAVGHDDG